LGIVVDKRTDLCVRFLFANADGETPCAEMRLLGRNKMPVGDQLASDQRYVRNQSDKRDGAAKRVYLLRRAHRIYSNLCPCSHLGSTEALCLTGKGNARIDVYVM